MRTPSLLEILSQQSSCFFQQGNRPRHILQRLMSLWWVRGLKEQEIGKICLRLNLCRPILRMLPQPQNQPSFHSSNSFRCYPSDPHNPNVIMNEFLMRKVGPRTVQPSYGGSRQADIRQLQHYNFRPFLQQIVLLNDCNSRALGGRLLC